jgi:hypothetical protein
VLGLAVVAEKLVVVAEKIDVNAHPRASHRSGSLTAIGRLAAGAVAVVAKGVAAEHRDALPRGAIVRNWTPATDADEECRKAGRVRCTTFSVVRR